MERQEILAAIRENPDVSVLVIGAGVNGIGVFRDLALQGVDVLLVDRGDFCSGASAASSHMLHGGIRYLENGEFRLVREALRERNLMLLNAPHLAKPLPTTIPIFKWFSGFLNAPLKFLRWRDKPGERGAIVIKLGLTLYDWFARDKSSMPGHELLLSGDALYRFPKLNPDIICAATYYDAFMPSPERICIELITDAEAASERARALNYVSVVGGGGDTVTLRDELADELYSVKPRIVVNAAGPWIDFVQEALSLEERYIGGTKGSHLILDHPELYEATGGHEIFFENKDGRIVLIFPWMGRVMVGTSDIYIDNPDDARCAEEEADYFLELVKVVFPRIEVNRSHIVFRFSGVRPLPKSDAAAAGQISRDHSVKIVEPNRKVSFPVYSLVGGKWTTWRAFAEQTTDMLLPRLGKARLADTAEIPIGGGRDFPPDAVAKQRWIAAAHKETGIDEQRLALLLERYGTWAREMALFMREGADQPLQHQKDYTRREIIFLAQRERVIHLDDLLLRRTLSGMRGCVTNELLCEVADLATQALNWTEGRRRAEIERVVALWRDHHGVELGAK